MDNLDRAQNYLQTALLLAVLSRLVGGRTDELTFTILAFAFAVLSLSYAYAWIKK